MPIEPEDQERKGSMVPDLFLGLGAFIVMVMAVFMLGSIHRGDNFNLMLYIFAAIFIGLLVVSIRQKRTGLILGFAGAIGLSVLAGVVLVLSMCGGMFK